MSGMLGQRERAMSEVRVERRHRDRVLRRRGWAEAPELYERWAETGVNPCAGYIGSGAGDVISGMEREAHDDAEAEQRGYLSGRAEAAAHARELAAEMRRVGILYHPDVWLDKLADELESG